MEWRFTADDKKRKKKRRQKREMNKILYGRIKVGK